MSVSITIFIGVFMLSLPWILLYKINTALKKRQNAKIRVETIRCIYKRLPTHPDRRKAQLNI